MTVATHVCAISGKECWQGRAGEWYSNGGFPLQMAAIGSLFDCMTLVITRRAGPGQGAIRLPNRAEVAVLRRPAGSDLRRKVSVLAHLPRYLTAIAAYVRRADVVHVDPPGDIALLGMLVALVLRKRLIVRYCGSWFSTAQTTPANRVTRALMRYFAGGRNVMLATGEAEGDPAPGVHWIFATALSTEELREMQPLHDKELGRPPRLAYIGRLSPEKGLLNLIDGVHRLDRDGLHPLPRITLIGDGPQRAALADRVRALGYQEVIHFMGQLDRLDLSAALTHTDFCVQPSLTEGFSKAWLDAFAHGLPVLASEAGAARQVIGPDGQRGWLVPPGDVSRLTEQLRSVLTMPQDWQSLRRRCRAYAEGHTLEAWATQIGQICARQWGTSLVDGRLRG